MIQIPRAFAQSTITREGEVGRAWLAQLPHLVADLCTRWDLAPDGSVLHGYLGLVIPVRRGALEAVLKVGWQDEATVEEAAALAAWQGQGAVLLLDHAPAQGAMLLERLDHRRTLADQPLAQALAVSGALLRRLAIPAPPGFRAQESMVRTMVETLPERWADLGRPLPAALLAEVVALAQAHLQPRQVTLVNYDLHPADVLAGGREPWLAVDPKVVAGDPEFGIFQLLLRRLEEMEAQGGLLRHVHMLAEAADLDPQLARVWSIVRAVDYWLWGLSMGLTHDPERCRRIVEGLGEGDIDGRG